MGSLAQQRKRVQRVGGRSEKKTKACTQAIVNEESSRDGIPLNPEERGQRDHVSASVTESMADRGM